VYGFLGVALAARPHAAGNSDGVDHSTFADSHYISPDVLSPPGL
jgi:hypothetical protein